MNNPQIIAERIKQLAKSKNLTVKDLLKELGIKDKDFLSKIENGTNVGYMNLIKIAEYLNCSMDYLIGRTDDAKVPIKEESVLSLEDKRLDQIIKELEHMRTLSSSRSNRTSMKHVASRNRLKVKKKVKL